MILLDKGRIERTAKRMTYQILEEARDKAILLAGLNTRGYALAEMIRSCLEEASGHSPKLFSLDTHDEQAQSPIQDEHPNSILFIVDDVIFSGQTMFRALKILTEHAQLDTVSVVVLVDRGHRTVPVLAGIVGTDIPTKLDEHVELRLEKEKPHEVILTDKPN
jgi:pyrimidine operon attenuation protein/uracil phosphoribosyltransferase